jgi:hypothetical protein
MVLPLTRCEEAPVAQGKALVHKARRKSGEFRIERREFKMKRG